MLIYGEIVLRHGKSVLMVQAVDLAERQREGATFYFRLPNGGDMHQAG